MKIFSVYDAAVAAYATPFFQQTKGLAIRSFGDACKDPESQLSRHPKDFTLFELGEFNEVTGKLSSLSTPLSLGTALELSSREAAGVGAHPGDGLKLADSGPAARARAATEKYMTKHSERTQ